MNQNETPKLPTREPVQIVNGVMSIIGLLVAFGVVAITPEQQTAVAKSLPYIIAGFSALIYVVNRYIVRPRVTPVAFPHDNQGNLLVSSKQIEQQ